MKKKQRYRWQIAFATRLNAAGGARNADLDLIEGWFHTSRLGVGGTRQMGIHYTGGDYWI